MPGLDLLAAALGVGLVLLALADVFGTLWHPSGSGPLSGPLALAAWRSVRGRRAAAHHLFGPALLVLVVVAWATLVILGAALVYWPHLEDGAFAYAPGVERSHGLLDAVYVSGVVLSTLGLGDVAPSAGWLRIAVLCQGLLGFSLLTAAVTWVLQLQSALVRRRAFARLLSTLSRTDPDGTGTSASAPLLATLLDGLVQAQIDLRHSSPTYFFRDADARDSLSLALPYAERVARAASGADDLAVRTTGATLAAALDDLAAVLAGRFLRVSGSTQDVLRAYARDQGHTVP